MNGQSPLERLRQVRVLASLHDEVLDTFARIAHEEEYATDQVVFDEGAEGDAMFLVLDGMAVVQKTLEGEAGEVKDLAMLEPGAVFGEMALFDRERRSATVRARQPLRVLRISRGDLDRFLEADPRSASAILGGLLSMQNARLREADQHHTTMYQIVNVIAAVQDTGELGRQVLERLLPALPHVDAGAICLWSPYQEECDVVHVMGIAADDAQVLSIARSGPIAAVLRESREPFVMDGLDASHPVYRLFHLGPDDTLLLAPLAHGRDLVGFIVLAGRGAPFRAFHRIMLATIATPVAAAIVNARYAEDEAARGRLLQARARQSGMPRL